jgi:CRISPR system Cascade subunit CasD
MNTLFLRLEGPLQAWGLRARWEERDSAFEPTKSGVVGLLGCALGLRRDDDRLRSISERLVMGVRVDRQGTLLVDYHTTGGVKEPDGEPEGMLNAEGKLKRETDVSKRVHLMDASFLVALHGPVDLVADLSSALQNPIWPVFLGRKACVPTCPVFAGLGQYETVHAALLAQPLPDRAERGSIRLVLEVPIGQGIPRNDAIGVPARRLFWPRAAAEEYWTPPDDVGGTINTLEG